MNGKNSKEGQSTAATAGRLKQIVIPSMKYAIEQRLRFIDFLIDHYNRVNRNAVVDYFGISIPQVTKDFKMYMKIAPDNIRYSHHFKAYVKNEEFERLWG